MQALIAMTGVAVAALAAPDLEPVSNLTVTGNWQAGDQHGDAIYFARLRAALAATVAPRAALTRAKRLRWTVTCPERAGVDCAGTATLRTRSRPLVVARASFAKLAPGKRRTFETRVGRAGLRRLRERPRPALRAVVRSSAAKGPRAVSIVRVADGAACRGYSACRTR